MPNRAAIESIRQQLAQDRAVLVAAVDAVPRERRDARPASDRWSVAEIVEHIAIVESLTAAGFGQLVAAAPDLPAEPAVTATPFDRSKILNRTTKANAPDFVLPASGVTFDVAWRNLEQAWSAVDVLLNNSVGKDLTAVGRAHPFLGQLDGYQWLNSIGGHELRHAAQITEG